MILRLIKYYPILLNIYILVSILLYFGGVCDNISYYSYTFLGQSFYLNLLVLLLSFKFRFCFWHRLLIYNMSFCLLLETIHNYGVNVSNHIYIVVSVTVITIFMAIIIYIKHGTFNKKKANNSLPLLNKKD